MYICMYVHVCLYICNVYMYACMYVYMHIYMHIYMHFNDLQFSSTRPRSPESLGQVSAYGRAMFIASICSSAVFYLFEFVRNPGSSGRFGCKSQVSYHIFVYYFITRRSKGHKA